LTSDCFNGQGYRCEWPSGTWIACMNMGHGYGYKVCYDCIGKSGCRDWCTCQSQCICCECQTVADLRAEQHRQQAQAPHEHEHEHESEHKSEHEHAQPARAAAR
jgi:hypothetical protein